MQTKNLEARIFSNCFGKDYRNKHFKPITIISKPWLILPGLCIVVNNFELSCNLNTLW